MPRSKDAPSLFELVQKSQPEEEGPVHEPEAPPEPADHTAEPPPADPPESGQWVGSDGERVRFSLSVIGVAVGVLGCVLALAVAYTAGKYLGGLRSKDRMSGKLDPIAAVMLEPPQPEVLGDLTHPAAVPIIEPAEPQADPQNAGDWILGLNYVWVETFKTHDDALQAQAFLKRHGIGTTSFPYQGQHRLFADQGFDYSNADDKAACESLMDRILQLGQQYMREGGRYKFGCLAKKMTAPW